METIAALQSLILGGSRHEASDSRGSSSQSVVTSNRIPECSFLWLLSRHVYLAGKGGTPNPFSLFARGLLFIMVRVKWVSAS